jgi:uncharacterized membrane protein YoaK (UPF0700 family)
VPLLEFRHLAKKKFQQSVPMADRQTLNHKKIKGIVALALAFVAGAVDIIGYISFGGIFPAHLTGDTVHLGQHVLDRQWSEALSAGVVIVAFLGGSLVGRTAIEVGSRTKVRSIATATLLLEAGLLSAVIVLGSGSQLLLLGLLAAAMGMQTATLTRVGPLTIHTTFVNGMVNKLAQLLSHATFLTYDVFRGSQKALGSRLRVVRRARFIFSVWFLYLLGAIAGSWARAQWKIHALLLPICLITVVILVDLIFPLSIEEEREASER